MNPQQIPPQAWYLAAAVLGWAIYKFKGVTVDVKYDENGNVKSRKVKIKTRDIPREVIEKGMETVLKAIKVIVGRRTGIPVSGIVSTKPVGFAGRALRRADEKASAA